MLPYIEYMGVKYRSELLNKSTHLINTKVSLHVDVEDLRRIRMYLPDGREFGELFAAGKWSAIQHSLQERKALVLLKARKLNQFKLINDPINVNYEYLATQASQNKRNLQNNRKTSEPIGT